MYTRTLKRLVAVSTTGADDRVHRRCQTCNASGPTRSVGSGSHRAARPPQNHRPIRSRRAHTCARWRSRGNGGSTPPSQPPLPSSPRTDPNTLWQLLERTHGDVPEVRLVRASWLLGPALASKSSLSTWERFPSRNTLERLHPEAFLPTAELRKLANSSRSTPASEWARVQLQVCPGAAPLHRLPLRDIRYICRCNVFLTYVCVFTYSDLTPTRDWPLVSHTIRRHTTL